MEKAILDVKELNVTQGMNSSYSHKGDLAIDMGYACSYLKAPFTGVVKRIYTPCNGVWLQSKEKVLYADGTRDYMTIMTLHDNDVSNLKKGQTIKKGTKYYQPGKKGNVTGSHIHIAVGKGKFKGNGWKKNKYGNWCIQNQYDITKALILGKDVKVKKAMYDWTTEEEVLKQLAKEELNKYYPKPKKQYLSIVDALKSINVDSSFTQRSKIAKANNINVYVSSASQNIKMLDLLQKGQLIKLSEEVKTKKYYSIPSKKLPSIVDALKLIKVDSSYSNRSKIAKANGITLYVSSSKQNIKMLDLLYSGKLIKA